MKEIKKVAVLGAGAWGCSLAIILSKNIGEVCVWAREKEVVESVESCGENSLFLPDIKIPEKVKFTNDPKTAIENADLLVWGVPIQFLADTAKRFAPFVKKGAVMINAGKGIEIGTWRRPSQVLRDCVENAAYCGSIMGPNIAFEVAKGNYAEAVVAIEDLAVAEDTAKAFCTPTFCVRASKDVVGIEVDAALKNIVALAAGFCDGMELGANTKAIIMARGFQEIYRASAVLGAWSDSFIKEPALLGDVLTTCMSPDSRNRRTGEQLGRGKSVAEALAALKGRVCAGLETIQICRMFKEQYGLNLPIMTALCDLSENKIDRQTCLKHMLESQL